MTEQMGADNSYLLTLVNMPIWKGKKTTDASCLHKELRETEKRR